MFKEALAYFGGRVKGVRGTWLGGGHWADNFNSLTAAVQKGEPLEVAAFKTFTGKMAERAGFTNAKIVQFSNNKVVVEFTR